MVIINSNYTDQSTNDVIDWLIYNKVPFKRINFQDKLILERLELTDVLSFTLRFVETGERLESEEISFYWYRRGDLNISIDKDTRIDHYLSGEEEKLKQLIHHFLTHRVPAIGSFYDNNINKMIVLENATQLGIKVPNTLITPKKNALKSFIQREGRVITKAIDNTVNGTLTSLISSEQIDESNDDFFYSLFQSYTEKFVELRIFFLKNRFWASAIFSQSDERTSIDFRNYNYERPNRITPFSLPVDLERKLILLNKKVGLTSGSIDMIFTPEGDYVLLEINPIGQFRNFSYFNNYHLEKEIADYIIKNRKINVTVQL
ncbi:MAG: grasp-with-spasm system ATP-grasp peptide maturase [Chryseobacterium sp.]|nr:MAG: grasp-with-spasm system ATP-grasp peptide maturase [Chryseobacterium sp.]